MSIPADNRPLIIPYNLATEIGREGLEALMAEIRAAVEAATGVPQAWRTMINADAIKLEPVEP